MLKYSDADPWFRAAGQTMNNFSGKIIFAPLTTAGTPSGGNFRFNGGGSTIN